MCQVKNETSIAKLTESDLVFLVEETRRREKTLDETIEAVTRKAYYAFTLATSILAFFIASVGISVVDGFESRPSTFVAIFGLAFYTVGACCFWYSHSTKEYVRIPNPERIVEELQEPEEGIIYEVTIARAEALIGSGKVIDRIARIVDIQHDMLIFQIVCLLGSWLASEWGH